MVDIVEPVVNVRVGTDITEDAMKVHNLDLGQSAKRGEFETVLADGQILIPRAGLPTNELLELSSLDDVDLASIDNEGELRFNTATSKWEVTFPDRVIMKAITANSQTIANTAAETTFDQALSVIANALAATGRKIRITIGGHGQHKANDGVVVRVKIGGVTIWTSESSDGKGPNATDIAWGATIEGVMRSTTEIAVHQLVGFSEIGLLVPPIFSATATITTAATSISVTADWDDADAANQIQLTHLTYELYQPNANQG